MVFILKGPSSGDANNFVAGACGAAANREIAGTTNKGQCNKVGRNPPL